MTREQSKREALARSDIAFAADLWCEDDGEVLWWRFPVAEPPYVGSPLDDDFPAYVTHWTRIRIPDDPALSSNVPEPPVALPRLAIVDDRSTEQLLADGDAACLNCRHGWPDANECESCGQPGGPFTTRTNWRDGRTQSQDGGAK